MFIRFCSGSWGWGSESCGFVRGSGRPLGIPQAKPKGPSMSVTGIYRQLASNASCESVSVIDLPDLPVEKLPTTRQGRFN